MPIPQISKQTISRRELTLTLSSSDKTGSRSHSNHRHHNQLNNKHRNDNHTEPKQKNISWTSPTHWHTWVWLANPSESMWMKGWSENQKQRAWIVGRSSHLLCQLWEHKFLWAVAEKTKQVGPSVAAHSSVSGRLQRCTLVAGDSDGGAAWSSR